MIDTELEYNFTEQMSNSQLRKHFSFASAAHQAADYKTASLLQPSNVMFYVSGRLQQKRSQYLV